MRNITKIPPKFLLPLISASSVLREEKLFNVFLLLAKKKKIPSLKIYEALLQSYLFAGFPSALISLKNFHKVFPNFKSKVKTPSYSELRKRGEKTCKIIYGDKYDKLISNVKSFSPDLAEWLVIEGYGKVLSRNQLSLKERELCIIAILTVIKFEDQLHSHILGGLRAGNDISVISELFEHLKLFNSSFSSFGRKILNKTNKS